MKGWLRSLAGAAVIAALTASASAAPQTDQIRIGLLLLAIDVHRDHLKISEAVRISNPGPPVALDVQFILPPAAQYVTFHRGLVQPKETARGFSDHLSFRTGLTEVAYSYALPTARRIMIARSFPFRLERMEVVVRGRGVAFAVMAGQPQSPLVISGEQLQRWEVRSVPAGGRIVIALDNLPTTVTWIAPAVALGLALVLGIGLAVAVLRAPSAWRGRLKVGG